MTTLRWHKVWRDLWGNRLRTSLVVLSIAIGVFAIGMIVGTQRVLNEDLAASYAATNPADAVLQTDLFGPGLAESAQNVAGVDMAEARRFLRLRLKVGPDMWRTMRIYALADYGNVRLNSVTSRRGAWPPSEHGLLVEEGSLGLTNAAEGDTVTVRGANGDTREMPIEGVVKALNVPPAQLTREPYAYISMDALEWLGYAPKFNQLYVSVAGESPSKARIKDVASAVEDKVVRAGTAVDVIQFPNTPAQDTLQALLIILSVLGALSLFAGSFLVINTITDLLTQQTEHIGIMKAVGGQTRQIAQMYLITIATFSVLALIIAIPLAAVASYLVAGFIANLISFDLAGFRVVPQAVLIEVILGILVPVLAGLYPILSGTSVSVREALSEYGVGGKQFGVHFVDSVVSTLTAAIPFIGRPTRISIRNIFRHKARLVLTLCTMILGGTLFIAIISVHSSVVATLDDAISYFNYDVGIIFDRFYHVDQLRRVVDTVPGVARADNLVFYNARRVHPNGEEGDYFDLLATPPETTLIQPDLLQGRWLQPDDENALVVNTTLTSEDEPDVKIGDAITLKVRGKETMWRVVGLVRGTVMGSLAYARRDYVARLIGLPDHANQIQVVGQQRDPASQVELSRRLETQYERAGIHIVENDTTAETARGIESQFNTLVLFLLIMATLVAAVGGLGLAGMMSINVLERTREIGVMRAIGASRNTVLRLMLVEGLFVSLVSWLISVVLAYPVGKILSDVIGTTFIHSEFTYRFSLAGVVGWLIVILVIGVIASFWPARKAINLSVRTALAYE